MEATVIYILKENYDDGNSILGVFDSIYNAQNLSGLKNWREPVSGNKWVISNRGSAVWWSIEAFPLNTLVERPWL